MSFGGKDNRGPSIAELQRYIREKVEIVFLLQTGENITGRLRWFDESAFSVEQDGQQPFTILRSAVVGYRKRNSEHQGGLPTVAQKASVGVNAQTTASEQSNEAQLETVTTQNQSNEDSGV